MNRVDLEEYLYGVVPAEMGPKRFDAIEALKAQAVAARTYALAHRGQFDAEGYDLCATPKCQVYGGFPVEDPLTQAAVDGTRGLVLAYQGQFADALFVSTCGGATENVENVFSGGPVPYLVSVDCGELAGSELAGASVPRRREDGGAFGPRVAGLRAAPAGAAERRAARRRPGDGPAPRGRGSQGLPAPPPHSRGRVPGPHRGVRPRRGAGRAPDAPRPILLRRASLAARAPLRRRSLGVRVPAPLALRGGREPASRRPRPDRRGVRGPAVLDRAAAVGRHGGLRAVPVPRGLAPLGQGGRWPPGPAGGPRGSAGTAGGRSLLCRLVPDPARGRPAPVVEERVRSRARAVGRDGFGRTDLRARIRVDGVGAPRAGEGARAPHGGSDRGH